VAVQSFPSSLLAGLFGFSKADFFELSSPSEGEAPKVDFA
ncbi:MAG: LemA family protein, partial [Pyramidobacter sp.]|nr:LemA family protein [Pyramidobacter sp.]